MRTATQAALREINRRFYERFAGHFSQTRSHPWPGWHDLFDVPPRRVLDLGCGNGRYLHYLRQHGEPERYVGTDLSLPLLHAARQAALPSPHVGWVQHDLLEDPSLPFRRGSFDQVVAFGVLHHVPGHEARVKLLRDGLRLLAEGGSLALTFWQFENETRFDRRRRPWSESPIPVDPLDLEPGDHLLRWGDGETRDAVRYCHGTSADEAREMAHAAGGRLVRTYLADGKSGRLNLYAIFEAR